MEARAIQVKKILNLAFITMLIISSAFLLIGYSKGHFQSPETMRSYLSSCGIAAPIMLVLIQAMQVVIPVLPGWLGCIVGAGIFGAAGGFWCNYIGISLGSIAAYFLAKEYGKPFVEKMVSMEKHQKVVDWVQKKNSYTAVFALAILLPMAPDDFLCYFSGLTGMSTKKYVWIILLCKPWCIMVYSLIFANII